MKSRSCLLLIVSMLLSYSLCAEKKHESFQEETLSSSSSLFSPEQRTLLLKLTPVTLTLNSLFLMTAQALSTQPDYSHWSALPVTLPLALLITQSCYYTAHGIFSTYRFTKSGMQQLYAYLQASHRASLS